MTKKKICFVVPEYQVDAATHFPYIFEMIARLSSDFQIRCIIERSFGSLPSLDGVELYVQQPMRFLFRVAQTKINILRARAAGYCDFYVHYSFFSAFFASLLVRIFGGRVFYWNCGLPWQYQRNWFREQFERLVYKMITFLVTGTEGIKREYAKQYNIPLEKIQVLPNWIDIEKWKVESGKWKVAEKQEELRERLNIPENAKILLFVHRLSKRKGAHYLPEILKRLQDENIVLLVVGDGPERKALELQTINYQLQTKIRFLGWIPQNEIVKYFAIADVFMMPSEEEGFPHVLLEAMASGVPFVASNIGVVSDIIPQSMRDYLVAVGDVTTFSQKINKLIFEKPEALERMKQFLARWVVRYDLFIATNKFIEITK